MLKLLVGNARGSGHQHWNDDDRESMASAASHASAGVKSVLKTLQMPDMLERVLANISPDTREQAEALESGIGGFLQHIRTNGPGPNPKRFASGAVRDAGEDTEMQPNC